MATASGRSDSLKIRWGKRNLLSKIIIIVLALMVLSAIFGDKPPTTTTGGEQGTGGVVIETDNKKDTFDILGVVDKTKDEVSVVLGTGVLKEDNVKDIDSCNKKKCSRYSYQSGLIDIIYVDGKSNIFTLYNLGSEDFDASTLKKLGIIESDPSFSSEFVMRWYDISGLESVEFFSSGEKISYIYIKKTDPNKASRLRSENISKCFSARDGSVKSVERYIKDSMNDPSSYEHVKTVNFQDPSSDLEVIVTDFRGKNGFGALIKNTVVIGIDISCTVQKAYTEKEQNAMVKKLGL